MDALKLLSPGLLLATAVYSVLGMILLMVAYKVFDIVNALEFTKELEKNNQALGTVIAGFFIAIGIIVAAAIHG
jgi:uncharacterized membrane protein YjfL (UPF0719 family)